MVIFLGFTPCRKAATDLTCIIDTFRHFSYNTITNGGSKITFF